MDDHNLNQLTQPTFSYEKRELDPNTKRFLEVAALAGVPPVYELPPDQARSTYKAARAGSAGEPCAIAEIKDQKVPGPHGEVPIRIYRQKGVSGIAPTLIYFHGGGWTIGDLDTHDVLCRDFADKGRFVVIAVDYRLSPEHKFPVAVEESFAVTNWIVQHAAELGVNQEQIALGGDSAGANLAAVLCLMARDAGSPKIAYQLLIYPATDQRATTPSHRKYANGYLLTEKHFNYFRSNYVDPWQYEDWRASPLLARDVQSLPPALIITAGFDPLHDEGLAYAERLRTAGVNVKYHCFEDQVHGFLTLGGVIPAARSAASYIAREVAIALNS